MSDPQPGIYSTSLGDSIGALSKLSNQQLHFVITNSTAHNPDAVWHAELKPHGQDASGRDIWVLVGHPKRHVFIHDAGKLLECENTTLKPLIEWSCRQDITGRLFREPTELPVSKFPTPNFEQAVSFKDITKDDPDSPITETIVRDKANYKKALPTGPIKRQIELVGIYTDEQPLYHEMNQALRDDDYDQMHYYASFIRELREVFLTDHEYQIIKPFVGTVYRGITVSDPDEVVKQYQPFKKFVWSAFTSTSTSRSQAEGFGGDILFEIRCYPPEGMYDDDEPEFAPADINEFSKFPKEDEVLFPPNTGFKVLFVQKDDSQQRWVVTCDTMLFDTFGLLVEIGGTKQTGWERLNAALTDMAESVSLLDKTTDSDEQPAAALDFHGKMGARPLPRRRASPTTNNTSQAIGPTSPAVAGGASRIEARTSRHDAGQDNGAVPSEAIEDMHLENGYSLPEATEDTCKAKEPSSPKPEVSNAAQSVFNSKHEKDLSLLDRVYAPNIFRWATCGGIEEEAQASSFQMRCAARLRERGERLRSHSLGAVRKLHSKEMREADAFLSAFDASEHSLGNMPVPRLHDGDGAGPAPRFGGPSTAPANSAASSSSALPRPLRSAWNMEPHQSITARAQNTSTTPPAFVRTRAAWPSMDFSQRDQMSYQRGYNGHTNFAQLNSPFLGNTSLRGSFQRWSPHVAGPSGGYRY